jgi:hypothetical protein
MSGGRQRVQFVEFDGAPVPPLEASEDRDLTQKGARPRVGLVAHRGRPTQKAHSLQPPPRGLPGAPGTRLTAPK